MKKLLLIFTVFCLLASPAWSEIVMGGALGIDLGDIKEPGGSLFLGFEENADSLPLVGYILGQKDKVRLIINSLNYGNVALVDNAALMGIHYFGLGEKWDVGARISLDYEMDDGDMGVVIGIEGIKRDTIKGLAIYFSADAAKRPDIGNYFQFGFGLIFSNITR